MVVLKKFKIKKHEIECHLSIRIYFIEKTDIICFLNLIFISSCKQKKYEFILKWLMERKLFNISNSSV